MLRKLFGSLILAGLVGVLVVGPAQSGGSAPKKFYTAAGSTTPSPAPAGGSYTQSLTITNDTSSNQTLGSANVNVPSGFTVPTSATAYAFTASAGKSWSIRPGSTVSSTGPIPIGAVSSSLDVLNPGESVTVSFTATAPCTVGTSGPWTMEVKQANDFNGQPGNDFQLRTGTSYPTTTVGAGGNATLDHFNVGLPSVPSPFKATAGSGFTVTVTAIDVCGNTATGYTGSATLSGTLHNAPDGTQPSYGTLSSFSNGQATGTVTGYKAEAGRTVTATAGNVTGTSSSFEVLPGPADHLTFSQQPSDVAVNTNMSPAPQVSIFDHWGNLKTNANSGTVTLNLHRTGDDPSSGDGTATGNTATPSGGVATFNSLQIDTPHTDYYLVASYPPAADSPNSDTFQVAAAFCQGGHTCTTKSSNGKISLTFKPDQGRWGITEVGVAGTTVGQCWLLDGTKFTGTTMGYAILAPQGNLTPADPNNPAENRVVITYDKSVAPGTGVANFVDCKNYMTHTPHGVSYNFGDPAPGGGTYQANDYYQVPPCPTNLDQPQPFSCVFQRKRTGAGQYVVTMWLESVDPVVPGNR